jgi:putative membrane protein
MRFVYPFWGNAVLWTLLAVAVMITILARMRSGRRRMDRQAWRAEWLQHRQTQRLGPGLHALDMRYARGEIGRDDYLQRRSDILSTQTPAADRAVIARAANR